MAAFDLRNIKDTVDLVEKEGVKATAWELDATNEEAVSKAIDEVEEQLGLIAVVVNCAAIVGSRPVLMEKYKNFWKTMEINTGAVYPIEANLTVDSVIINMASRSGSLDLHGTLSYSVSKFAVIDASYLSLTLRDLVMISNLQSSPRRSSH